MFFEQRGSIKIAVVEWGPQSDPSSICVPVIHLHDVLIAVLSIGLKSPDVRFHESVIRLLYFYSLSFSLFFLT